MRVKEKCRSYMLAENKGGIQKINENSTIFHKTGKLCNFAQHILPK